jgi:N-methylhydantoinase A
MHTSPSPDTLLSVGVDIGGTFTDFVVYDQTHKTLRTFKIQSTPSAPEEAVIQGLSEILKETGGYARLYEIIHGSTVATNALLERKGARTALVTTYGFKDLLVIGRQNRGELYNLFQTRPPALVPAELRLEVSERVSAERQVLIPLDFDGRQISEYLQEQEVESVAVCLLFSFLHPEHETTIADFLRQSGFFVSASVEVLPEFREYERTSATVINAYVSPTLGRYLHSLQNAYPQTPIRIMQSNGGSLHINEASRNGLRCILSGPAGGVAAAISLQNSMARQAGNIIEGLVTFDMGGTSTDVSLVRGEPEISREVWVGELPLAIPVLDIHTIGAGGGSIASLDPGGALTVGPHSAGADPGPAAYGTGSLPTVIDANLVLGRLIPEMFLGGKKQLFPDRARKAVQQLADQAGLSLTDCALGIIEVANMHMAKALRLISVERGFDPRSLALLSFGGAGGLHAVELAHMLGFPQVVIPPTAAVFSAVGMLVADTILDFSRTVMLHNLPPTAELDALFQPLVLQARQALAQAGFSASDQRLELMLDLRYVGQSYELTIPLTPNYQEEFHRLHARRYGYQRLDAPLELVNLRVRASGLNHIEWQNFAGARQEGNLEDAYLYEKSIQLKSLSASAKITAYSPSLPVFRAERLPAGAEFLGPALLVRDDTTILIGGEDHIAVDTDGNIVISLEKP